MEDQTAFGNLSQVLNKVKPFLAMLSLQFGYSGMYIITMVSFKHGMSHWVLSVYRHVVATLVIAPFAIVLERKIRPKMTLPVFLRLLVLGFLEPVLDQNLYNMGMKATSTTYASAFVNLLPAITFVLALIFRLETVNIRKMHSLAKLIGTAVTVGGAMVMTLYKGPILDIIKGAGPSGHNASSQEPSAQNWVTGTIMLIASCGGWASFFILQSFTLKLYPAELSLTAWICFLGIVEGSVISLIMERDNMSAWALGWDSRLLACVYSGVVCSGIAYYVQGTVIRQRGPVFVTSFSPLCMIITAALGSIVLAERIYLGSVIGAIFIVMGLYTVVWGKSKDRPVSETLANDKDGLPIKDTTKSVITCENNEIDVDADMFKGPHIVNGGIPLTTRT